MAKEIVIIGAGPAGMMAGIVAANNGAQVYLLEHNNIVGKKMGITGKGRCNITNTCSVEELIKNTPGNGKFLYSAYNTFNNEDLLNALHEWGLETKVERGNRVFPLSDSAIEVRNFFIKVFKRYGGHVCLEEKALQIEVDNEQVTSVKTNKGLYKADAVIIATGGVSYAVTGSTGDGHKLAKALGHKVTPLLPALVPLETKETWVRETMGLTLKNVKATLFYSGKKRDEQFGELLFTHFGLTGPIILTMSREIALALHNKKKDIYIEIDVKPALTMELLDLRVQRDFEKYMNRQLGNGLKDLLPHNLIPHVIGASGLTEDRVINKISKEERRQLVHTMKHLTLHIKGTRPIAEAIVTCGGVSTKEVNPKTMESKLVKGLYFAGEVLHIDALTGGFNLQAAFSTGYVAGLHASGEEE